jgi:nucleoid-associated protein YgaU
MPDQEREKQEGLEAAEARSDAATEEPGAEAGPESAEGEEELSQEEREQRALELIRAHKQAYRKRIDDAKAMIRTRGEYHRAKRMGKTYTYAVQPGDTLETVAKIFYAKPERWPEIYEANAERVAEPGEEGPQPLDPGTELVIP